MSDWPPSQAEVQRSFDARAATYDNSDMHRWVAAVTAEALAPVAGARIVDAAAGTALAGRWLLARDPRAHVLAIDLAPQLLAAGRRDADRRLWPVQADAAILPVRTGSVDGVVCASAMAYMPDPSAVLAEFARVLRGGDWIAVQVWAADGLLIPAVFRQAAASVGKVLTDPNAALGRPARLRAALARAGFAGVNVVEQAWREPLQPEDVAWSNIIQSTAGTAVRTLGRPQQHLARERFLAELGRRRALSQVDSQLLYVATARRT